MNVKLNALMRAQLVSAVMRDLPQEDFDAQIHKAANLWLDSQRSTEELKFFKKFPQHIYSQSHAVITDLHGSSENADRSFWYFYVEARGEFTKGMADQLGERLLPLFERRTAQRKKREQLTAQLEATLNLVNSIKQLQDSYPDIAAYTPKEWLARSANALMVTPVVDELKKAGWPDKKGAKK